MPRTKKSNGGSASVESIQSDLQVVRDDVAHLVQQVELLLTESGNDAVDEVKARLRRAKDTVDQMLAEAGAKGRDAATAVRDMRDNLAEDVEESIREHPFMSVALAVGVGFLLSTTLRR
jgi:ElaB/YqjD/DUF883 family membrane-anchored ribosome-binding protein